MQLTGKMSIKDAQIIGIPPMRHNNNKTEGTWVLWRTPAPNSAHILGVYTSMF